jgi:protein involved in polysaccharide export with SLBB domain
VKISAIAKTVLIYLVVSSWFLLAQESQVPVSADLKSEGQQELPILKTTPHTPDDIADKFAALDAETVAQILRDNPGLMLEVRKRLIKRAYNQGHLVQPGDFATADILELIHDDAEARVIATQEIVRRDYLKLQPTEQEVVQRFKKEKELRRAELLQDEVQKTQVEALAGGEDRGSAQRQDEIRTQRRRLVAPQAPGTIPDDTNRSAPRNAPRTAGAPDEPGSNMQDVPRPQLASLAGVNASGSDKNSLSALVTSMKAKQLESSGLVDEISAGQNANMTADSRAPRISDMRHRSGERFTADGDSPDTTELSQPNVPYRNLPALYDLYMQAPSPSAPLRRFGLDIFQKSNDALDYFPMDIPASQDYVIGPGDGLNIELWGAISQRLQRTVDREGRLALPEVGAVPVAGKSLDQVQAYIQNELRREFHDISADVSLSRLRTVRVYVVGEVANPGAYDISALSTPLNALYAAGGPSKRGSLRTVQHYRGTQMLQEVDLYDLILHGVRSDVVHFQPGDTLLVPQQGASVTVEGMVRRPAIYEVGKDTSLLDVLNTAGGVLPTGTYRRIEIERTDAHRARTTLRLEVPDDETEAHKTLETFIVQDEDKVRIAPILPYSMKSVYVDGHVFNPGKYAFNEGMKVSDLIKAGGNTLPEPFMAHAELIRLSQPDFRPVVVSFDLEKALAGDPSQNLPVQPFDTVRIFSRFDFEDRPVYLISGEVRHPGRINSSGDLHLADAVYMAGGLTPEASLTGVQVVRRDHDATHVFTVNLSDALKGDSVANISLRPRDQLLIHRAMANFDPASILVGGEVMNPGRFPLGSGLTLTQAIQLAGGMKRSAVLQHVDVTRYDYKDGIKVEAERETVDLRSLDADSSKDLKLRDGDVIAVQQVKGFKDIGATAIIQGEVGAPSTYGIRDGERLSSLLKRAGGFTASAYPEGIFIQRVELRDIEERNRLELIRRYELQAASVNLKPGGESDEYNRARAGLAMQERQILEGLKSQRILGRLVVHINGDIKNWENTANDVQLRKGDLLIVPKKPNFVLVSGQVYGTSALSYSPGRRAKWYLQHSGGVTEVANLKSAFIVRADGSVLGRGAGSVFSGGVLGTTMMPGDTLIIPEKLIGSPPALKALSDVAQVVSAGVLAAKVAGF